MYTFFKRTAPHPNLSVFDCPDSNTTNLARTVSNTPLMALTTLNNQTYVETAQALARRVLTNEEPNDDADRVTHAFRICVARPPSSDELERLTSLLASARDWYGSHAEEAGRMIGEYRPEGVSNAEAAAWTAVSRILLNMDEFITRE
jgi:hypothetical protein